jgi:hypothetical protein
MLTLTSTLRSTLGRTELSDFVVPVRVSVRSYNLDVDREYTVGRIEMDRILWDQARRLGVPLYDVCDGDSQGMHEMHVILTNGTDDIRDDFELDEPTDEVLFVHRMLLHPDLLPHRTAILNAAVTLHSGLSLTTIWQETCDFTDQELYALGFRKIAGEPLFARHWTFASRFEEKHPAGLEVDFEATPEHERWLKTEWKREELPPQAGEGPTT